MTTPEDDKGSDKAAAKAKAEHTADVELARDAADPQGSVDDQGNWRPG